MEKPVILGIDAGGTFTDFVCLRRGGRRGGSEDGHTGGPGDEQWEISIHKTLSTPEAPEQAILTGIADLQLERELEKGELRIIHGSTVATNAALEGNTARTAFITNHGFGDMLTLARQTRPELYALEIAPVPAAVPAEWCLETGGRFTASGEVLEDLDQDELEVLINKLKQLKPEAIAINLLFSFLDDHFELAIESAIHSAGISAVVCRSSKVLPVYKEYERGIATWLNASLGPVVQGYLSSLGEQLGSCSLQIMQSSGETISAKKAAESAVNLLLSGPAGGLAAMKYLGEQIHSTRLISLDMGGTSTDVALLDGEIGMTTESSIGHYPVAVPSVDMHTIGAGGGSIAFVDSGGLLQVGPRSAGARPGPACYGQGGTEATVTDANLVLGRLLASSELAGGLKLQAALARAAIGRIAEKIDLSIEETALGIIDIANELMARAIREISVNRGYDPKEFILASFGGAGGLHVCALADAMEMRRALVPDRGGVLSALGMLVAPRGRQFTRTVNLQSSSIDPENVAVLFQQLEQEGRDEMLAEGLLDSNLHCDCSMDVRYVGQSYTLNIPWSGLAETTKSFHAMHQSRYGYQLQEDMEFVNLRAHVRASSADVHIPASESPEEECNKPEPIKVYGHAAEAKHLRRANLRTGETHSGPAIITEYSATTYVAPGWSVVKDRWGNLELTKNTEPT